MHRRFPVAQSECDHRQRHLRTRDLQDRGHGGDGCACPSQIAKAVATRKIELALVQHAHDLGDGAELEEGLEHKLKPLLHPGVGVLDDDTARVADKPDRQGQRKVAAFGFGKKTGGQSAADRVQLEL